MNSIHKLLGDPSAFLKQVFENLKTDGFEVKDCFLDHICYRTESGEHYNSLKNNLSEKNLLLVESEINGRNISVFKLKHPIEFEDRKIPLLELPSPKPGSFYPKGWEHVEFVLNENLDAFLEKHPQIRFDKKGFSKKLNRDLRRKYEGMSVKFHEQSLEEVIRMEMKT